MLKAVITSPTGDAYGVTFEAQSYGRPNRDLPSFYLPCASYDHARAVAKAYNGVAFTEDRPRYGGSLKDNLAQARAGRELNHYGEPIACGMSRTPDPSRVKHASHARPAGELPPHVTPAHDDVIYSARYRGAPLGMADYTAPDVLPHDLLHFGIRRVALDEQGYAPDGVYWGLPQGTLWHARAEQDGALIVSRWFRAPSYAHAVARIRDDFRHATTQRVAT